MVCPLSGVLTMEREGVPAGLFVFVSATGLLATWWAYKQGLIEFRDVRAWLACHELVAQRCTLPKGVTPRFRVEELGRLVGGVGGEHLRASVRRLESASLLSWSDSAIRPRTRLDDLSEEGRAFVEAVTNHRRLIPVPRRLLRFLAGERRPVLVATALGHLLRCMYYRNGKCSPSGLCKASWIADVLGVDERNVKAARAELERLGVLIREPTPQLRMNRYGLSMRFNLAWGGVPRRIPPRRAVSTTELPPLRETGISSSRRSENQNPGAPGPSGVRKRTGRGPSLSRVLVTDLKDPKRLLMLLQQARRQQYIGGSESERLNFFAAAQRALRLGRTNPAGFFARLVRKRLWHYLAMEDEDRAQKGIVHEGYGEGNARGSHTGKVR